MTPMTSTSASSGDGRPSWWVYHGTGTPVEAGQADLLPPPPPWRAFTGGPPLATPPDDGREATRRLGADTTPRRTHDLHQLDMINAALVLRRPLLVTGQPGTGKSSLAYLVARELQLGPVLRWAVTSSTTLRDGLYNYDAIGRVQASAAQADVTDIGKFVQLGPLGTAFLPYERPRVLLIDELDKSDIDLPNDLLSLFEDGEFAIPELTRIAATEPDVSVFVADAERTARIHNGVVRCRAFPFVVITSNGEREFPPALLRRCLRLELAPPSVSQLASMVAAHFPDRDLGEIRDLAVEFAEVSEDRGGLAMDQLLNAVHLVTSGAHGTDGSWERLRDALWRELSELPD